MKRFQFKLDAVLKLRKLKEENCRTELGLLLQELNRIESQIQHEKEEIDKCYQLQEASLKYGAPAGKLQAIPGMIQAKDKSIQLLQKRKRQVEDMIAEKKDELAVLRGELKVMENLKEKDFNEWKKAYNKETDQKVEEQTQLWLAHKEKKAIV